MKVKHVTRVGALVLVAAASAIQTSCAQQNAAPAMSPAMAPARSGPAVGGYLPAAAVPSSGALAPTPPAPGSGAMARDEEVSKSALAMHGTPRWEMATNDAVLSFPQAAQTFSCALNLPVSEEKTPKIIALLRRTLVDAGRATSEAKQLYMRTRPFAVNGKPTCTPDREDALRKDGSYPSGHASVGYAFGLVLSEVVPDRTTELVARGRAFGQSRLVCNVHWQSDVLEGQMISSAVVARLNAEPAFRSDVAAARAEAEALRAQGLTSTQNCASETATLKSWK
jgi:acid phosphatase (class A)